MNNQYDPEYIKGLFNKMSGSYERVNYITSFGFSLRWRKQFLKPLKSSNENIAVLDLMTGMGETWHPVKKHFPNCNFTALDFSEGMLEHARKKNYTQFQGNVKITNQNALDSNFPDEHFDVILSAFGLKTFNEDQLFQLAVETKRLLKPGGTFSFIEVSQPKNNILRGLYKLHLKHVVPVCGRILLGNPQEYRMLWKYTEAYKNAELTKEIFEKSGLEVKFESYFGGCATGISGMKRYT
ncbi:methyltransferase domain-containing protein [bacterium]|nr:MAG: methyltransferase domain-containing protein [bacterium]